MITTYADPITNNLHTNNSDSNNTSFNFILTNKNNNNKNSRKSFRNSLIHQTSTFGGIKHNRYKYYYYDKNRCFCTTNSSDGGGIGKKERLPGRPSFMDDLDEEIEILEYQDDEIKKTKKADSRIWNPEYDEVDTEKYEIEYITDDEDEEDEDNENDGNDENANANSNEKTNNNEKKIKKKVQHRVLTSSVREDIIVEYEEISGMERIYSWMVVFTAFYVGRLLVRYAYIYGEKFGFIAPLDPSLLTKRQVVEQDDDDDEFYENDDVHQDSVSVAVDGNNITIQGGESEEDEHDW